MRSAYFVPRLSPGSETLSPHDSFDGVLASDLDLPWENPPQVEIVADGFAVADADGSVVYEEKL